jgi:alanine dehydrogenase
MSEVAGKLSVQIGAHFLEKENGGSGVLLGGVPGTRPAKAAVVGGGVVGTNAAKVAVGMGAEVTVLDISLDRLRYLADVFGSSIKVLASDPHTIEQAVAEADLVIGALLVPGAKAKKVITKAMMAKMRKGSVIVDVAIDQGGCVEGAVPTSHQNPVIDVDGIILCCVANLPGAVARTSTFALTNATFPYVLKLAGLGYKAALKSDSALARGLNVLEGRLVNKAVAEGVGLEYVPFDVADL